MLEDADMALSGRLRLLILELKHEWEGLEARIEAANVELQQIAKQDDACHRLMEIPGFGPLVSTALVAAIGNGITFRKGRDLSAWLGLVPRQHSTGRQDKTAGHQQAGKRISAAHVPAWGPIRGRADRPEPHCSWTVACRAVGAKSS